MTKYFTGVGRRKTAIAQARIEPSKSFEFTINGQESAIFPKLQTTLDNIGKTFKISIIVCGGGITSQKDALVLAVARAITKYDIEFKPVLRKNGLLTRDSREKERKKPGLKGARRAPQWAKR